MTEILAKRFGKGPRTAVFARRSRFGDACGGPDTDW